MTEGLHAEEFAARVGTMLRDKWRLERLIAVGGMAGVFVAKHKIGRVAAIKLLRPEIAIDKRIRERFEQEASSVNSIGHDGIVQVLDVDETEDGTPFLVMELLEGETLADRVEREGKLRIPQLLDVVDQLLDVLVACHRKGVIHRDIKPENLFLLQNGRLKVLDFGIARVREGVRTMAGTMLGTVAFMPPEQLKGLEIDARADLYAVGATMFGVLAGRRIHVAENDTELAMKILTAPAPRIGTLVTLPEQVCLVVDRALAWLPDHRYPDAQTMRGDIWAARRGQRPPYAYACNAAGLSPEAMKLPVITVSDGAKRGTPEAELPSTDPQIPVFLAAAAEAARVLPSTDPQMPIFTDKEAEEPSAKSEPERPPNTDHDWPPGKVDAEASSLPPTARDDELEAQPEGDPASEHPSSLPLQGKPISVDARQVAQRQGRSGVVWLLVGVLLIGGAYAAYWVGLFDASKKPKPAPSSTAR